MDNFGFEFNRTSQPEFSDFMNQKIYEKILWDKIKLLENPALNPNAKPDKKKKDDDLADDDDKDTKTMEKIKDGKEKNPTPGKKRTIKVLAIVQEPYIYKKSGAWTGIVYDIWKGIKIELAKKYEFKETFIKTLNYTRQIRKVESGEYDIALTSLTTNARRSKMVNFTRPIFINQQSILTSKEQSYAEYLWKIGVNLFLPPLVLLAVVGFALGCILYYIEPKRGFKEATFGTVASMFGEMGGVVENSSLGVTGMIIVFIIMTISFYFTIFLQAATVEKLIEFKEANEITVDNLHTKKLLYAKGSGMGRAFKRLGANVKGVEIEDIKELKQKFLDERPKWDGIAVSFMDAYAAQDENFSINKTNFGLNEEAIAVRIGENRLLKDIDVAITKLQDTYEIRKYYNQYFGDEYDFMGIL